MQQRPGISRAILCGLVVAALLCLGACNTTRTLEVGGLEEAAAGLGDAHGLWIENFEGSITITVDPSARATSVRAIAAAPNRAPSGERIESVYGARVAADTAEFDGVPMLRIRSTPSGAGLDGEHVDLVIETYTCDALKVVNRGGAVHVLRAAGPIDVSNAAAGGRDGSVYLRTDRALTRPVRIVTTGGDVTVQVNDQTTGAVLLSSTPTAPRYQSFRSRVAGVRSDGRSVTFTLGGGANPIELRSDDGSVTLMVVENPVGLYSTYK